jgi:hypothetical protein
MKHCSRGLAGWWASRVGMGGAGCRDHGLGGLVEGSDARGLTVSEQRRLPCRSGGSGRGSCGPADESHVRVVVAGLQGLDHSRDPGRGRAVGDGMDHVAADPWIGIPGQLEQPRPHPLVVGPDVAGTQVPARELASPALLAPGQLQQSVDSILGCAPLAVRQADPYLLSDLAPPSHRPDDSVDRVPGPRIIPPAGGAFGPLTSPGHSKWPGRPGRPRAARSSG